MESGGGELSHFISWHALVSEPIENLVVPLNLSSAMSIQELPERRRP